MRLPFGPTLLVAIAVAIMVGLGVWQLSRGTEKDAQLAAYAAVPANAPPVAYSDDPDALFRRTAVVCDDVLGRRGTAGSRADGAKGWAHIAQCRLTSGEVTDVALGWSADPAEPDWPGGAAEGVIGARGQIVADPPLAGLAPLASPDPGDLPNNHRSYAGQWFLFALVALVIYAFALRRRRRDMAG